MINIAIIGAGQLGSRHLQALANSENLLSIQVIDPSIDSLKTAEIRFNEIATNFTGKISYSTDIATLERNIEIAIVATNSKVRRIVIERLISQSKVKNLILEKFLFTKEEDYYAIERLLNENRINAWVNCARRIIPFYKDLQKELSGNIHFTAVGNAWGLGCNSIHLLDLFAFFTQTTDITLSNDLIDKSILESKRAGYIEFTGTITGYTDKHSFLITSFPSSSSSPLQIRIDTPNARYSIEEGVTAKVRVSKMENGWKWEEWTFQMPFQSQMTNRVIEKLLDEGTCDLPSYKESSKLHVLLLKGFIGVLQKMNNDNSIDECLIT